MREVYDTKTTITSLGVLGFIVAMVVFIIQGCSAIEEGIRYADYAETEGIVIGIDAVVTEKYAGNYTVKTNAYSISYSYSVSDEDYTGVMISYDSVSVGTPMQVLYNPESPELSKGELNGSLE